MVTGVVEALPIGIGIGVGVSRTSGVAVANAVGSTAGVFVGCGVVVGVAYLARINVGVGGGRPPLLSKSLELQAVRKMTTPIIQITLWCFINNTNTPRQLPINFLVHH